MKTVLVLVMLVVMLYGKVYKMETRSAGSLIARLIKANLYQKYLEERSFLRAQILKKGSQPIMDYYDDIYTGNITVGTPDHYTNGKTFFLSLMLLCSLSGWTGRLNMSMGGSGGLITYGAVDTTNCDHHVNYVYLTSETYWQFSLEGFSIGSFSEKKAEDVISDTGTSWIGAPSYIVNAVVNQTGAQLNYEYGFYTVLCSTMLTQPDLEFSINGVKYNVISEEYIIDLGLDYDTCAVAFFGFDAAGFGPTWILGDPWIRIYCNIYDFGQQRVGFAKAKHSES